MTPKKPTHKVHKVPGLRLSCTAAGGPESSPAPRQPSHGFSWENLSQEQNFRDAQPWELPAMPFRSSHRPVLVGNHPFTIQLPGAFFPWEQLFHCQSSNNAIFFSIIFLQKLYNPLLFHLSGNHYMTALNFSFFKPSTASSAIIPLLGRSVCKSLPPGSNITAAITDPKIQSNTLIFERNGHGFNCMTITKRKLSDNSQL